MINEYEIGNFLDEYYLKNPKEDNWNSFLMAMRVFLDCWSPNYRNKLTTFIREENTFTINDINKIVFTLQEGKYNIKIDVDGSFEEFSIDWRS